MTTTDKDFGWKNIVKELTRVKNSYTKIGVQAEDAEKDHGGVSLIVIAATNEFGTTKAGKNRNVTIPSRPFIRGSYDKHSKKYADYMEEAVFKMYQNKLTYDTALKRLGQIAENDIKSYMSALSSPGNAASTIRQKHGTDNPLIDTGQLRNSIRHVEVYNE